MNTYMVQRYKQFCQARTCSSFVFVCNRRSKLFFAAGDETSDVKFEVSDGLK